MARHRGPATVRLMPGSARLGVAACVLGLGAGLSGCAAPWDSSVPTYALHQTDSAHPGHRRTTVTFQGAIYVNDFEEAALHLEYPEPDTKVVARSGVGDATIRAIPGEDTSAYLAVDMGSEMPAFAVFRNVSRPPFDWRHAVFKKMRLAVPEGALANQETTDAALIDDVVSALRDGRPVDPPVSVPAMPITGSQVRVHAIQLYSDAIPGLVFQPAFYLDEADRVFVTDDFSVTFTQTTQTVKASWIRAGMAFTRWVQAARVSLKRKTEVTR